MVVDDGNLKELFLVVVDILIMVPLLLVALTMRNTFEWADGNPNNEDRRGYSVVIVKIRMVKLELPQQLMIPH